MGSKSRPQREQPSGDAAAQDTLSFVSTLRHVKVQEQTPAVHPEHNATDEIEPPGEETTSSMTAEDTSPALAMASPELAVRPETQPPMVSEKLLKPGSAVQVLSTPASRRDAQAANAESEDGGATPALPPRPSLMAVPGPTDKPPVSSDAALSAAAIVGTKPTRHMALKATGDLPPAESLPDAKPVGIEDRTRPLREPQTTTTWQTDTRTDGNGRTDTMAALASKSHEGYAPEKPQGQTPSPATTAALRASFDARANEAGDDRSAATPAEGDTTAKMLERPTTTDSPSAVNRVVQAARQDIEQRPEWLATGDRHVSSETRRIAPAPPAERPIAPPTDTFRENNLSQIIERVAVSVRGEQSEARITLKPDHLGSLRLQIATENNTVSIKITTEFPMARDLLESHLPQLKAELQQQGLDVEEFRVTLSEEQHHFRREERRAQGQGRARPRSEHTEDNDEQPRDGSLPAHQETPAANSEGVDYFA